MTSPAIECRNVTRILTDEAVPVTLVKDASLAIHRGEFVAIVGPSGGGKSSLMYLLGLLDRPTSGNVIIDGVDTSRSTDRELEHLRLEKIGFVFQFHFLLPEFSVLDNLLLPMHKLGRLKPAEAKDRARSLLAHFGLEKALAKKPGQLSGGERQRVAIARALANEPLILLADEPTGNLDTKNADLVFSLFERLVKEEGKTVITITHDPELAARAKRQIRIKDGHIEA